MADDKKVGADQAAGGASGDREAAEFFELLEGLDEKGWATKVTDEWTVKDVVAHLVGWEREVAQVIGKVWRGKVKPWFFEAGADFDEFNRRVVQEFKEYSPEELLAEWRRWQAEWQEEVEKIGEEKLRGRAEFDWLFDEGDGHYAHHLRQIKGALGR